MAMIKTLLIIFCVGIFIEVFSQESSEVRSNSLQLEIHPLEIAYAYPRIGLGLEKKFSNYSLWSSVHLGWAGLDYKNGGRSLGQDYTYWGIKSAIKKFYPTGSGEYFFEGQINFDKTSSTYTDGVYYNLEMNTAVLFDEAKYRRSRLGFIIEHGYEFFMGNRLSMEISGGVGIRRIKTLYDDVENPFLLSEVTPREIKKNRHEKYVGVFWRPAFTGSLKFGWRL